MLGVVLSATLGCAANRSRFDSPRPDPSQLNRWVETELAPYLTTQLSTHPRFRGQPILLVAMNGADVSPRIDAVSAGIRRHLLDRLLQTPGVRMSWRPATNPPAHHRSLTNIDCQQGIETAYYIGIETRSQYDGNLAVSVRALDPQDGSWVSGFGKSWEGRPSAHERRALTRLEPDPYLRGLRPLPFETSQADLIAGYLARNLSCLLRASDNEDLVLRIRDDPRQPPYARRTLTLVGNYLARYREVRVTTNESEANLVLSGKSYPIDGSLHQFWAIVQRRNSGRHLSGIDTAAYVRTAPPAVSGMSTSGAGTHLTPRPEVHALRAVTPRNPAGCDSSSTAWMHGERVLSAGATLAAGSCFALEIDADPNSTLFLLQLNSDGQLSSLSYDACNATADRATTRRRWPPRGASGPNNLQLDDPASTHTYYAIAMVLPGGAAPLANHLRKLDTDCGRRRLAGTRSGAETQRWLAELDRLMERHANRVAWRSLRITGRGATL